MKKKRKIGAGICILGMFLSGTVFAAQTAEEVSHHSVTTGTLRGRIEEEYEEKLLYPGGEIKKAVYVRNTGEEDMKIRLKISKEFEDPSLDEEMLRIDWNEEYWEEKEGWHYYKEVLEKGERTKEPVMEAFLLEKSAGNEYAGQKGNIRVNLECIQTQGKGKEEICSVSFLNFADGFSFQPESTDLFPGFQDLMPGDSRTQELELSSQYPGQAEFFLSFLQAEQAENEETVRKLLKDYCELTIRDEKGNLIYQGNAAGAAGQGEADRISLGDFSEGDVKKYTVSLTVSPEIGNDYQKLLGKTDWVWRAESPDGQVTMPNLGIAEDSSLLFYLSGGTMVFLAAILLVLYKRKGGKQ